MNKAIFYVMSPILLFFFIVFSIPAVIGFWFFDLAISCDELKHRLRESAWPEDE